MFLRILNFAIQSNRFFNFKLAVLTYLLDKNFITSFILYQIMILLKMSHLRVIFILKNILKTSLQGKETIGIFELLSAMRKPINLFASF